MKSLIKVKKWPNETIKVKTSYNPQYIDKICLQVDIHRRYTLLRNTDDNLNNKKNRYICKLK